MTRFPATIPTMNATKTYTINSQKTISETLDNETIIINLETGSYYSMNPAGTALWNAIATNTPIDTTNLPVKTFLDALIEDSLVVEGAESNAAPFTVTEDPQLEKYTDMQEMLLADPIHDVDESGWPNLKKE